ncbi:hypothetical protein QBC38DRAFT_526179 [Podospora fimiseda]|uniref:Peptidase A1 domain-containing protein n=1 Tax=Podospora fimiseda TaxID=252190 RepID=A0AAN7GZN3_9PEZI|nr:hypothetical protein QBC38DRAFT_526179 [Podospora fimiseda]
MNMTAIESLEHTLPGGLNYSTQVGTMGIGTGSKVMEELFSRGKIGSLSSGLHIGSVQFQQPGSLILGGYDQSRVIGPIGVFDTKQELTGWLTDVVLGTQVGPSAFQKREYEGSVWLGPGQDRYAELHGRKNGTTLISFNPAAPYISLPEKNCEIIASRLPVIWNSTLENFLWNTSDPAYTRIVRSSAYLGFVFSDRALTKITIKVPFPFLRHNQARNLAFLAQAPGPGNNPTRIQELKESDTTLESNPTEEFERSWQSSWEVLQDKVEDDKPDREQYPDQPKNTGTKTKLTIGTIAEIAAGSVAMVLIVLGGIWFWRRQQMIAPSPKEPDGQVSLEEPAIGSVTRSVEQDVIVAEVENTVPGSRDIEIPRLIHEAPPQIFYYEMSTENLHHEMDGK